MQLKNFHIRLTYIPIVTTHPSRARLRRQSCCCAIWGGHVKSDLTQLPFHFIVMIEITKSPSPAALHSLEQFYPVIRPWDIRFLMKRASLTSVQVNLSHIVFSRFLGQGSKPYMIELLIRHQMEFPVKWNQPHLLCQLTPFSLKRILALLFRILIQISG
ncbi:hypothetical protein VNO80_06716 [Phaseolus coccineus]|uniref:Uncharacterized protein n=1 Tax=Phaseolus coccineus TaxID=3886 RepID=A0AAN9NMQ5_PHACN